VTVPSTILPGLAEGGIHRGVADTESTAYRSRQSHEAGGADRNCARSGRCRGNRGRDTAAGGLAYIAPIFLPNELLQVWLLSLTVTLLAGLFPAWKASRLSPPIAMRV
jgi:ABC-type antimicrobial peptide transport system permease subunit